MASSVWTTIIQLINGIASYVGYFSLVWSQKYDTSVLGGIPNRKISSTSGKKKPRYFRANYGHFLIRENFRSKSFAPPLLSYEISDSNPI